MTKYEQLSEIIFPEIKKTIDDLEKIFPPRKLKSGAFVTRFAPSPTGFLHTGSLFAAMIGKKLAVQTGGIFYVRLEDTDQKREVVGSGNELIRQLTVFGVEPLEGYFGDEGQKGDYGPYIQSERAEIYKIVIKEMIRQNLAYPCFCTPEQLTEMRQIQENQKDNFGYFGKYAKCSLLTPDEQIRRIESGERYVLRFRSKGHYENKIEVNDAIRGNIKIAQNDQHIVILKSDNLPTYHFAHLVDDHFMRTTHVTRGEEWLASLPVHIELFESMNWQAPVYAHLPVIMKLDNGNRRKLSKRKDLEAAVSYFIEMGYPVDGFMEYLFTIANSNFEEWRIENPTLNRNEFIMTFDKMSLDGALFDLAKIQNLCKENLGNMTTKEFVSEAISWSQTYDVELYDLINRDLEYFSAIVSIEREKVNPRKDYEKFSDVKKLILFFYREHYDKMFDETVKFPNNISTSIIINILITYRDYFSLERTEEEWFNDMKEVALACGFAASAKEWKQNKDLFPGHVGDVAAFLRLTITERLQSPNLYFVMQILQKEEVVRRIDKTIAYLNNI